MSERGYDAAWKMRAFASTRVACLAYECSCLSVTTDPPSFEEKKNAASAIRLRVSSSDASVARLLRPRRGLNRPRW